MQDNYKIVIDDMFSSGEEPNNFLKLNNRFIRRYEILKHFAAENKPSHNQLVYLKTVSLHELFKNSYGLSKFLKEIEKKSKTENSRNRPAGNYRKNLAIYNDSFPKIGGYSSSSKNDIRFEPFLNRNLLRINLKFIKNLITILNACPAKDSDTESFREIVTQENSFIEKEIGDIDTMLNRVPEIMTKNMNEMVPTAPNENPKVSIVTMSLNVAGMVDETMRSILNQTYRNFENVIVDGASTDKTVEMIKKYPNVTLVSEKDKSQLDAFWKGVKRAKGEYIMQCCISDCYANTEWVEKCVDFLDRNKDVSLVWGFPCGMTEQSKLWKIFYAQFYYNEAPQREEMFNHWLKTGFIYPEVNYCVRKNVFIEQFPSLEECSKNDTSGWDVDFWYEFAYRFNKSGYLSYHLPMAGNFGRTHSNQLTEKLTISGKHQRNFKNYKNKVNRYRLKLILGLATHTFIGPNGEKVPIKFNKRKFIAEYINYIIEAIIKKIKRYLEKRTYENIVGKSFKRFAK